MDLKGVYRIKSLHGIPDGVLEGSVALMRHAAGRASCGAFGHVHLARALRQGESSRNANNGDVRAVQQRAPHASSDTIIKYDDNRRDLAGRIAAGLAEVL